MLCRVDALVFTAGVGGNSASIRATVCQGLEGLGVVLDPDKNRAPDRETRNLRAADSRLEILVVPTNEELEIAEQTRAVME